MGLVFVVAGTRNLSPFVLTEGSSEIPIVPGNEVHQMVSNFFYFLGPLICLIVSGYLIKLVLNDREKTRGIADSRTSMTIVLHLQWKY